MVQLNKNMSAVSMVISNNFSDMTILKEAKNYYVKIANNFEERRAAYELACVNYADKGFCSIEDECIVLLQDFIEDTVTVNAYDLENNIIGTVSAIVNDVFEGLPCDVEYAEESKAVKSRFQKVSEVVRLTMKKNCSNAQSILIDMFNMMYTYSYHIAKVDAYLIEVNPSHLNYYKKYFLFEQVSQTKKVSRVNGADGVLMMLNLHKSNAEVQIVGGMDGKVKSENGKTAYCFFLSSEDEKRLARLVRSLKSPMGMYEKEMFMKYLPKVVETNLA